MNQKDKLQLSQESQQVAPLPEPPINVQMVARELSSEVNFETITQPTVDDFQNQIRTVAVHMDHIQGQILSAHRDMPELQQQTKALLEGATTLEMMFERIDQLALVVESVSASVQEVNSRVEEAERELSTAALQPLHAVLETLKMGSKGFRS